MGGSERLPEIVETPRLTLRLWQPEDAGVLSAAVTASLDHLLPWMDWAAEEPLTLAAREQLIRSWLIDWEVGGDAVYGTFRDGTVVGGCGLHRRAGPDTLEIGYWTHVDHVGQGYATEVSRHLVAAAFTLPAIEQVEIHHDAANAASRRIPESLGFERGPDRQSSIIAPTQTGTSCIWVTRRPA